MLLQMVVVVVVAILAVFFANYNQTMVKVVFFGYPIQGTIGLFLVAALGAGLILGVLIMLPVVIGRGWEISRHKRTIAEMEQRPGWRE